MTKKRTRVSAIIIAILFFISAFALSIVAIVTLTQGNNSSNTPAACQDVAIETPLPLPTAYQPPSSVTSLQVTDVQAGTGATAKVGDCLVVKYFGNLASNGTVFDENFDKNTGLAFNLGQGQVILGWDQGLVGMKVGGTRRLVIPSSLGYGTQAQTNPSTGAVTIPANSTLVFVVKLLRIQ